MAAIPADPLIAPVDRSDRLTWRDWAIVLIPALLLRGIVLASGLIVSFNSDEAVVALMARHINQGLPIPTYFYGQAYLGSLDAILVSVGFRIFGESVATIRLVESILYGLIVITTVLLADRLSRRSSQHRRIAIIAGLLIAIPPVMFTLYTTMTLGGYGETLLFGNLIWLIGWDLIDRPAGGHGRWIALGLLSGLAWWTDALIVGYLIPIGLLLLIGVIKRRQPRDWLWIGLAGIAFVIGGAPWWIDNFQHNWEGLHWLIDNPYIGGIAAQFGLSARVIGALFLDFPAAVGARFPWSAEWWSTLWGVVLTMITLLAIGMTTREALRSPRTVPSPARFLIVSLLIFTGLIMASSNGIDSSGRYFLPVVVMLALIVANGLNTLMGMRGGQMIAVGLIGVLLIAQSAGHEIALTTVPPGLTSQFDLATDFTNDDDQQAIDFLAAQHGTVGFSTYWVTFRLAFLSHEQIILDAWLPDKASLAYTAVYRRYPPYTQLAAAAPHPVYVTANTPILDAALQKSFAALHVHYTEHMIGPYRIYYDLSQRVTPDQLGLGLPGITP